MAGEENKRTHTHTHTHESGVVLISLLNFPPTAPAISFKFATCPLCSQLLAHSALGKDMAPVKELMDDVKVCVRRRSREIEREERGEAEAAMEEEQEDEKKEKTRSYPYSFFTFSRSEKGYCACGHGGAGQGLEEGRRAAGQVPRYGRLRRPHLRLLHVLQVQGEIKI